METVTELELCEFLEQSAEPEEVASLERALRAAADAYVGAYLSDMDGLPRPDEVRDELARTFRRMLRDAIEEGCRRIQLQRLNVLLDSCSLDAIEAATAAARHQREAAVEAFHRSLVEGAGRS